MAQFLGTIASSLGGTAVAGTGIGATLGNFMGAVNGINNLFGGGQQQQQQGQQQGSQFMPLPQPTPVTAPTKTASQTAMEGGSEWEDMLKKVLAAKQAGGIPAAQQWLSKGGQ